MDNLLFHIYILQGTEYNSSSYFSYFFKNRFGKSKNKKPKLTFRAKLTLAFCLTSVFLPTITLFFGLKNGINYLVFFGLFIFSYQLFSFAYNFPKVSILFFNLVFNFFGKIAEIYFANQAKSLVEKNPDLKIIGIAGVYGKTSTKHFLKTFVESEKSVLSTPKSFNTILGVSKFVLKNLKRSHRILILEMGGYRRGDVRKIAKYFRPNISMITSTGTQHIEKYGSEENIILGDLEILEEMRKDGFVYLEKSFYDSEIVKKSKIFRHFYSKNRAYSFGLTDGADYSIKIEKLDFSGAEVSVFHKNDLFFHSKISLYTEEMISNLIGALVVFGRVVQKPAEDLLPYLSKIKPFERRFEVSEKNEVIFIDDSYNIGPESSESAFRSVKRFEAKRKILVTGGIPDQIEFERINFEFGEKIAEVFDVVILSKTRFLSFVKKGIESKNQEIRIFESESVEIREEILSKILQKNDLVLIQNELWDEWNG